MSQLYNDLNGGLNGGLNYPYSQQQWPLDWSSTGGYTSIQHTHFQDYWFNGFPWDETEEIKRKILSKEILTPHEKFISKTLDLSNTSLTTLQDNLVIHGDLDLSNTPIKFLSKRLTVVGTLNLNCTQVEEIPDDIIVRDSIYLLETPVRLVPRSMLDKCLFSDKRKKVVERNIKMKDL